MFHGQFSWYDLMTPDTKAAEAFYGAVIGWTFTPFMGGEHPYTVVQVGEAGVGGMMDLPQEARDHGSPPFWIAYITLDDVDAYAEKVKAAGGSIMKEPTDIPQVGRFAVAIDPQGASFMLFKVNPRPDVPPAPAPATPGTFGWRELLTTDLEAGFAFYAGLFGWTKAEVHDMGEHGPYQLFRTTADGPPVGGMMKKPDSMPAPVHWGLYIQVDSAKAAVERVTEAGGKVLNGPMQVPGGQWIAQVMDPQGGYFGVLSQGE